MSNLNETEIKSKIRELDESVPREGAVVRMDQYGGGPDESRITANKLGYLRLGIEFLKGAFANLIEPVTNDSHDIDVDIDYLRAKDSDINIDWFQRTEDIKPVETESSRRDIFVLLGVMLIIISTIIFAVIGLVTAIKWIL